MTETNQEQILKYKRKTDQAVTMHSILAERYSKYCVTADIFIWVGSTVLLMMTWFDPSLLKLLPVDLDEQRLKLWLGAISLAIFVASLLPLLLRWREKASEHNAAAKSLVGLKFALREAEKVDSTKATNEVISEYTRVMESGCQIPNPQFLKLKQAHLRKVAFSKYLDMNPGRLYLINRLCFFISNLGCRSQEKNSDQ